MQRSSTNAATAKLRVFDAGAVRQYFAGVEALAAEARASRDPRVLNAALAILQRQHATVRGLLGRKAKGRSDH